MTYDGYKVSLEQASRLKEYWFEEWELRKEIESIQNYRFWSTVWKTLAGKAYEAIANDDVIDIETVIYVHDDSMFGDLVDEFDAIESVV